MNVLQATQARKEWSATLDTVTREKPLIIKRTRDSIFLSNITVIDELVSLYKYHATVYIEDNGSTTLSLDEIDLVENAPTEYEAIQKMASAILEYAEDFYDNYTYWSRGNRRVHIPYVFKALLLGDSEKIGEFIVCHPGKI